MDAMQRKPAGRYPCGEETKRRIVEAAIDIFGREGFDGTSTRDIAAAAEVNPPAIQYYFASKVGLYHACVDRLTGMVWKNIYPAVALCQGLLAAGAATGELIDALCQVQNRMIESFFADDEGYAIRRLMAWQDAACEENSSGELMQDRIGLPIYRTFHRVVETLIAKPAKATEIEMHAFSLMGLSMIFHFNQSRVMDMLNWATLDAERVETLKGVTCKQLAIALHGLASNPPGENAPPQ